MERTVRRGLDRLRLNRRAGGVASLLYPLSLMGVTLAAGFRSPGDMGDPASSVLGALLFLIAAPTTWIFAIGFIDVSRFTVLLVGALSSLPGWYAVGAGLAGTSRSWPGWINRYLVVAAVWTLLNLLLFGALGALLS